MPRSPSGRPVALGFEPRQSSSRVSPVLLYGATCEWKEANCRVKTKNKIIWLKQKGEDFIRQKEKEIKRERT